MSRAILVKSIDGHWTSRDIRKYFKSKARGIEFVLYPFLGDCTRAVVAYLSSKDAHKCRCCRHKKVSFEVSLAPYYLLGLCLLETHCDIDPSSFDKITESLAINCIDRRKDYNIIGATFIQIQALVSALNAMGGKESTLEFRRTRSFRSSSSQHRMLDSSNIQLVFDNAVLRYIRKYHASEITEIENNQNILFKFRTHDKELCTVYIIRPDASTPPRVHNRSSDSEKAKQAFGKLYKSVEVIKKLVIFDCDLNSTELLAEVERVFPCLYCDLRVPRDKNR